MRHLSTLDLTTVGSDAARACAAIAAAKRKLNSMDSMAARNTADYQM